MIKRLIQWTFLRPETPLTSPTSIFLWWEKRRPIFNLVVGLTGLVTCSVFFLTGYVSEKMTGVAVGIPDPPIFAFFGIILYAVAANVCYTVGPIAELIALRRWKQRAGAFGEIAFFLGMIASVIVTLIPGFMIAALAAIFIFGQSIQR